MGLGREIASKPRSMINSALHLRPISSKRKLSQSLCSVDPLLCSAQLGAIYSRPWASLSPCRLLNSHLQQQGLYTHRRGFLRAQPSRASSHVFLQKPVAAAVIQKAQPLLPACELCLCWAAEMLQGFTSIRTFGQQGRPYRRHMTCKCSYLT